MGRECFFTPTYRGHCADRGRPQFVLTSKIKTLRPNNDAHKVSAQSEDVLCARVIVLEGEREKIMNPGGATVNLCPDFGFFSLISSFSPDYALSSLGRFEARERENQLFSLLSNLNRSISCAHCKWTLFSLVHIIPT